MIDDFMFYFLESAKEYLEYEKKSIAIFILKKVKVKEKTGNKIVCESEIFHSILNED